MHLDFVGSVASNALCDCCSCLGQPVILREAANTRPSLSGRLTSKNRQAISLPPMHAHLCAVCQFDRSWLHGGRKELQIEVQPGKTWHNHQEQVPTHTQAERGSTPLRTPSSHPAHTGSFCIAGKSVVRMLPTMPHCSSCQTKLLRQAAL